jgi:hypothetical protein
MKCNYFIPDSFSFFMSDITVYNYFVSKRQVICWIENHIKKIDNYIEN